MLPADNMRNRIIDAQRLEIPILRAYFQNMDTNGLKNINKIKNNFINVDDVREKLDYANLTNEQKDFFDKWININDNKVKFKLSVGVGRGKKHKKRILSKKNKLKRRPNSRKKKYSAKFIE